MKTSRFIISIANTVALIVVVILGLALLVFVAESNSPDTGINTYPKALWYTLVTLSTVGYGDIYPTTTLGKVAGSVTIICSVAFIGYAVGRLGEQVLDNNRRKFLGMNGTSFKHHYLVVGWSELSQIVVSELLAAGFKVALLADSEQHITEIRSVFTDKNLHVAFGQFESAASYERLNLDTASGVILLCNDDTRTLITVLHLREMRADIKITAYIQNARLRKTVESAGVSYVVSPNELIGRMIASATFEPDVGTFLEDVLSTTTGPLDLDVQEYQLPSGHELVGRTFEQAYAILSERCSARLLTYSRRQPDGAWHVARSLEPGQVLAADDYVIVLANAASGESVMSYLGVIQGRRT